MKFKLFLSILPCAVIALAQKAPANQEPTVRHVIGFESAKRDALGHLKVDNGTLLFTMKKSTAKIPAASIDDVFVGSEHTQSGGKAGRVVKTAAIAAPFGSGKVLTLMMRTKVDILTVVYHGSGGEVHGAIFALPIGLAEPMRTQLVAAGAHATVPQTELKERTK